MKSPPAQPFLPCVVVPYYRHQHALPRLIGALKPLGLHCFLVDDGNRDDGARALAEHCPAQAAWLSVVTLPRNRGKGAAVHAGLCAARTAGFTHAVQLDADLQHDIGDLPMLLALARQHPAAMITGIPRYDASVPKIRFYGRYLTHALVWLETLSLEIRDSMCGFRVYPIESSLMLWRSHGPSARMDFDTDAAVRMHWSGTKVICVPTRVTYPADGVSNYRYFRDNLRMIALHMRLLLGMLLRLPLLLWRKLA